MEYWTLTLCDGADGGYDSGGREEIAIAGEHPAKQAYEAWMEWANKADVIRPCRVWGWIFRSASGKDGRLPFEAVEMTRMLYERIE